MERLECLKKALLILLATVIASSLGTAFAQQVAMVKSDGEQFVGTWESERTNMCSPCMLKIERIGDDGVAVGTLTTDPSGTTPLNAFVKTQKGKVVLGVTAARGTYIEFEIPTSNKIFGKFPNEASNSRTLTFTKK